MNALEMAVFNRIRDGLTARPLSPMGRCARKIFPPVPPAVRARMPAQVSSSSSAQCRKPGLSTGASRIMRFRVPGGGATPMGGGITKKCPQGQVWTCFESPPGSGQQHCECRTLDIKTAINKPQADTSTGPCGQCPVGQICKCVQLGGKDHCFCDASFENVVEKKKTQQATIDRGLRFCVCA
jgi:hypothetical protein